MLYLNNCCKISNTQGQFKFLERQKIICGVYLLSFQFLGTTYDIASLI